MTLALEGVRVLDLVRNPPGMVCTMMLGDLGAEVIGIESPLEVQSSPELMMQLRASLFRNKKSIGLNLKRESGKRIFYELAQKADVVVEGFRPGVVKRLGVDYEAIKEINPRIVYCSITGYGQDGPYRDLPGHDLNYLAVTGVLDLTHEPGRRPVWSLNLIGDMAGGAMFAVNGILCALIAREKTGRGQFVDVAMVDGILSLYSSVAYVNFELGKGIKAGEYWLAGGAAWLNVYETKDGRYVSIACLEPWFWERLCRALGKEEFITCQLDDSKQGEMFSSLQEIFLTKTRDEWLELLGPLDIPLMPVLSMEETFSNPHVLHRRMVIEVDDPTKGKVKQIGIGIKLSDTPGRIRSPAPSCGQHTQEILTKLGYTGSNINELKKTGIVF